VKKAVTEGRLLGEGTAEYLAKFNESTVLILMIESPTGLSNLPDILSVPGIEGKSIGPHDFSVSSCVPEVYESAVFLEEVSRIIET
jgi:2-keto-3-deoxy-L-rhamnonate aldolase RhmA